MEKREEKSISEKLKELAHQAEEIFDKFEDKAEAAFDQAEDKAKGLWQQAKTSDVAKQANQAIGNMVDDASTLLSKLKEKLDGNKDTTNEDVEKKDHTTS